jgi:zinc D-Ala-D-Ala carboxypeptidase
MKWYYWVAIGVGAAGLLALGNRTRVLSNLSEMKLGENFSLDEFTHTTTGLDNIPTPEVIESLKALVTNILQPLRTAIGKPMVITSGYRSKAVNDAVGGASSSQHSKGQAADFHVAGMTNQQLIDKIRALKLPYDQLIDEQLDGGQWVHVSFNNKATAQRKEWLTARDNRASKYETVKVG